MPALQPFVRSVLDAETCARVEELARRYLAGQTHLLRDRVDADCIRDGHGDLQAEDILCLEDTSGEPREALEQALHLLGSRT
jgi:aminoglycoside phosphotransferase family enzyme